MDQFHYCVSFEFPDHNAPFFLGYLGLIRMQESTFLTFSFPLVDDEDQDIVFAELAERINKKWQFDKPIDTADVRILSLTPNGYSNTKFYDTFRRAKERAKAIAEGKEFWWREAKT